jgi:hypothetical protein
MMSMMSVVSTMSMMSMIYDEYHLDLLLFACCLISSCYLIQFPEHIVQSDCHHAEIGHPTALVLLRDIERLKD